MIRWFKSLFAWHVQRDTGKTVYEENLITGARRVWQRHGGYQPIDQSWARPAMPEQYLVEERHRALINFLTGK